MIKHQELISLRLSSKIMSELSLQPNRSKFVRDAIAKALRAKKNRLERKL